MPTLSRRAFGASLLGLPLAAALPLPAVARGSDGVRPVPPVARLDIGRFKVTFLSDGWIDFPYAAFTGVDPAALEAGAKAAHAARPEGVRSGFTVWLVDDGERLLLVDAGPNGTVSPNTGRLPAALDAVGVKPEHIDAVFVTHMHVDHIAGLIASGKRAFPNAELFVDARDVAYFTDPAKAAAAPDLLKSSFETAARVADLYPSLQRIDGPGREIIRGVSTYDLAGHTPGHQGLRIADGDAALTLVGDALFHPAIHPARADIGIAFEPDRAAADAMRARFFPAAAESGDLIAATHMPFPGLGRIVKDGAGLAWLPADWDYAA